MSKSERPIILTILAWCLILLHGSSALSVPFAYNLFSPTRYIFVVIMNILVFASAIGVLKQKKWSIFSYPAFYIINALINILFPSEKYGHLMTSDFLIGQAVFFFIIVTIIYKYRSVFK